MFNPHIQSIFLFEDFSVFETNAKNLILNSTSTVRVNYAGQEVTFYIRVMIIL